MKDLNEYINEEKLTYKLSDDYDKRLDNIVSKLVDSFPIFPGITKVTSLPGQLGGDPGKFWYNKYDFRRASAESAQYIGSAFEIYLNLDTKNNVINVDRIKNAIRDIFEITVKESVFDNNVTKNMPEYEWASKLYTVLSKFFNTKNFSKVHGEYLYKGNWGGSVFKEFKNLPTIEKDGIFITLYNINLKRLQENDEYSKITLLFFAYEAKDLEKVAAIKAANDARKPLDVMGRELREGDLAAYILLTPQGGCKGMNTAKIVKVNKDQVKFDDGHGAYANRTCLIARKDGKMIE